MKRLAMSLAGAGMYIPRPMDSGRHHRGRTSPTRVMGLVQLLQAFARDVSIDGGGGDVGVPQQQLHHPKIGAVIEKMRRKGVPQHVR